jgi:hypothetical protein
LSRIGEERRGEEMRGEERRGEERRVKREIGPRRYRWPGVLTALVDTDANG